MKDSQKPDHVSLANMVGRLREGRYVIPDFQRDFEWQPWDIKELVSSIFHPDEEPVYTKRLREFH